MVRLWYAPQTRAIRVLWLLEELGIPYELERREFIPTQNTFFQQDTPLGKLPVIEDGDVVMCESGAIVEYLVERYDDGKLAPAADSPARAQYLQWIHFAESTAFPPVGMLAWLGRYRDDADAHETLIEDTKSRAAAGFVFVEEQIGDADYLLGDEFSAADVMMGFTLAAAQMIGVLDDRYPRLLAYVARLTSRPALLKALDP